MKSVYKRKQDCYGCGSCANICPQNAITLQPDKQGFLYPLVDSSSCIDCGFCVKSCQIGKEKQYLSASAETCFGFKSDEITRRASSSGGVYTEISNSVLDEARGGYA